MATHDLWKGRQELQNLAQKKGEEWFQKLSPKIKHLPAGTLVAINVDTGEFVTAIDQQVLLADFKKQFGDTLGWVRELGSGR